MHHKKARSKAGEGNMSISNDRSGLQLLLHSYERPAEFSGAAVGGGGGSAAPESTRPPLIAERVAPRGLERRTTSAVPACARPLSSQAERERRGRGYLPAFAVML